MYYLNDLASTIYYLLFYAPVQVEAVKDSVEAGLCVTLLLAAMHIAVYTGRPTLEVTF